MAYGHTHERADAAHSIGLLRVHRQRPRGCAAQQRG
jgi:hypothetical protein